MNPQLLNRLVVALVTLCAGCNPIASQAQTTTTSAPTVFADGGGYVRGPAQQRSRVVVFVNGIFGDAISTWRSPEGAYWPSLLLNDSDFKDVDIFVHSFQSPALASAQQIDELAGRFRDHLLVRKILDYEEIVFIAHSMGGLVTRALLLKQRLPPSRTPMIYFYGTPSAGANVAGIAKHLSENPQLKDMLPLSEGGYVKVLRERWLESSNDNALDYPNKIASFCAYELRDTWFVRIVPELSATYLCNRETRGIVASHIDIVKPKDAQQDPYVFFKAAYLRTFGPSAAKVSDAISAAPRGASNTATTVIERSNTESLLLYQSGATLIGRKFSFVGVGCGEVSQGDMQAIIELTKSESVVEVRPTIYSVNVKSASVALIRHERGKALVRYSVSGLERDESGCRGRGHANVLVRFVVSRAAAEK